MKFNIIINNILYFCKRIFELIEKNVDLFDIDGGIK